MTGEMPTNEQMLKDIHDRMTALGEQVSEARLQQVVQTYLDKVFADTNFQRKFRFGGGGN